LTGVESEADKMKTKISSNTFTTLVAAVLLILTVWGNTWAMLGASIFGILVSLFLYPRKIGLRTASIVGVAFVIAFVVAMLLRRGS
jgi:hypothetical protein